MQALDVTGHDMGVNFGCLHIRMAKEILQYTDVDPLLQQMGGKAVPQSVAADFFCDPGSLRGPFDRLLQT